jgi:hypothetical protein
MGIESRDGTLGANVADGALVDAWLTRCGIPTLMLGVLGCCPLSPAPVGPRCGPGADAGVQCSMAPVIVPAGELDPAQFRAVASALVCERALRCGWLLAQSYCHPGFARLQAGSADRPIDARLARACVTALDEAPSCAAALAAAHVCLLVSEGSIGATCEPGVCPAPDYVCREGACALPGAGEMCTGTCEPPLVCIDRRCWEPPALGAACVGATECGPWLSCIEGACAPDPVAGAGDCCTSEIPCPGVCDGGRCAPTAPIGCGCVGDAGCPWDVSRCVEGICSLRPMLGDACTTTGPPCFGSACHDGACVLGREGDGCGGDRDCDTPLVCGPGCRTGLICLSGTCGPLREAGEPCGAGLFGRCAPSLSCSARGLCEPALAAGARCGEDVLGICPQENYYCHSVGVCRRYGATGDPCSEDAPCRPDLACSSDGSVCIEVGDAGEPCHSRPCRTGLRCVRWVCQ